MPLYEYECRNCKIRFERVQRMVDASLTLCPECGENALARVIQPVGVIFKGSGFYVTDNRSRSSTGPSAAKAESGKDAGKESGKETGKESGKETGKETGKESGKETTGSAAAHEKAERSSTQPASG
ncbi:MAG: FmdB family zinc ribbon protein [Anaerolineae bacterium]